MAGSINDHLASSDEDEPIINLNHLGHDTENEGLYPFRRSSSSQYHRVSDFRQVEIKIFKYTRKCNSNLFAVYSH